MTTAVNPLWAGTPEQQLGKILIKRDPATAKAECERILAEIRAEVYRELDAKHPSRDAVYDAEWDAMFQSRVREVAKALAAE